MNARYFYLDAAQAQHGPYGGGQIRAMARDGRLTLDTPLWREGDADWFTLADFPEFTEAEPPRVQTRRARLEQFKKARPDQNAITVVGLLCLIGGFFIPLLFFAVLALGIMSIRKVKAWRCSACGGEVLSQSASVCSHCGAQLYR